MNRLIGTAGRWLRRHVREVWESRGGGFYGFVAALTFLYLEAMDLTGDIAALGALAALDLGTVIGFVINNLVEAVMFTVYAALWPVEWISRFGVSLLSGGLLLGAYAVYRVIHPTVLAWLQEPEAVPAPSHRE